MHDHTHTHSHPTDHESSPDSELSGAAHADSSTPPVSPPPDSSALENEADKADQAEAEGERVIEATLDVKKGVQAMKRAHSAEMIQRDEVDF